MSDRYSHPRRVLGKPLHDKIAVSKVLMVGAGGIGCELIKNLVLTGFKDITMIDLDTIDVSNLNRQFLFRREHVGKSKAEIACQSSKQMNPDVNIQAFHGNIKEDRFDATFFKSFTIVLNALDNLDARRYVNKMCRANGVPLIESGTQGYLGQCQPILYGQSECFECVSHPTPKTFPACTIRNIPDKPHHCIVWSSLIYPTLFGEPDEDNMLKDMKIEITEEDYNNPEAFAKQVFDKLFRVEIEKQLQAKERWETRKAPIPITFDDLLLDGVDDCSSNDVPTVAQCAKDFRSSVVNTMTQRKELVGTLSFDKDDDMALQFVAAAANLRMHIYSIPVLSQFKVKGIAGNIIHAIATTNAVAAGLIVIEAIKVINGKPDDCRMTWIKRTGPKVLAPQRLEPPNPDCGVCAPAVEVHTDVNTFTIEKLFREVLEGAFGCEEPCIDDVQKGSLWEYEDVEEKAEQSIAAGLNLEDGALVSLQDDMNDRECSVIFVHSPLALGEYTVKGEPKWKATKDMADEEAKAEEAKASAKSKREDGVVVDLVAEDDATTATSTSTKRKRDDSEDGPSKRPKDDDIIEL